MLVLYFVVGERKVPQTRSAPYFSDSRRVGSSPVRTMGARTHFGVGIGVMVARSLVVVFVNFCMVGGEFVDGGVVG